MCGALPEVFESGGFQCGESNSTGVKHTYNEFASFMESNAVWFDINGPWNLPETMPVIVIKDMLTPAHLRYKRGFLTLAICCLFTAARRIKLFLFVVRIRTVMFYNIT